MYLVCFLHRVFERAYFIKFLIVSVAVQRTRQCKQTAKNRPNLEINSFSENCLKTSFVFNYLTFLRVLSNCMHVDLQVGATFEYFKFKYEQISTSRRHLENMVL